MIRRIAIALTLAATACGSPGSSGPGIYWLDNGSDGLADGGAPDVAPPPDATSDPDVAPPDPGSHDPGFHDPGIGDPGTPDPGPSDPGQSDPGTPDPGVTDPGVADPGAPDPGQPDPGASDPGQPDPGPPDPGPPDPGADIPTTQAGQQLTAARQDALAADVAGTTPLLGSWPVEGAAVTATRPAIGSDPEGYFLQASADGPALFVAASHAVYPGDVLSLTITELDVVQGRVTATATTSPSVVGGVNALAYLQDVSEVDVVTALDDYESELVTISGTFAGTFSYAGSGFQSAPLGTAAVDGGSGDLKLRVPDAVVAELDASLGDVTGCDVTVGPQGLWRYYGQAQPSAFEAADLSVSCAPPRLLMAGALSATEVRLTFDRPMDDASLWNPGSQLTFTGGLAATDAVANGTYVFVTTTAQTPGQSYTVTVASSVTDVLGTGVDPAFDQATFTGYQPIVGVSLVINEVDYDNVGVDYDEFIELYNGGSNPATLADYAIELVNGSGGAVYMTIALGDAGAELPPGGYLVVAAQTVIDSGAIGAGALTLALPKTQDNLQNGPDGLRIVIAASGAVVDGLAYEGEMLGVGEGLPPLQDDSNTAAGTLSRCPNGSDSESNEDDFALTTPTPGTANACF